MKHIFILLLAVIFSILCFWGCSDNSFLNNSSKNENNSDRSSPKETFSVKVFDETFDEPVKLIYQRNYEYSAVYESNDKEMITALIAALNNIEVVYESELFVDDYDDIITFVSESGEKSTVIFECKRLVKDNKRYEVNGYDRVSAILSSLADEESEY